MTERLDVSKLTKHEVAVDHIHKIVQLRFPNLNPNINVPQIILENFQALEEPWDYDLLSDMSEFDGFVPWEHLEAFADTWAALVQRKDDGRGVAIFSVNPLIHERLDGYQELWPGREFRIVTSLEAGREWLIDRRRHQMRQAAE